MGLGAQGQNVNSGNRGSSWRYEFNVLKALECIVKNTESQLAACCPETNALLTDIKANQTNGTQETHINNGPGVDAVPVQDGGNSLTVDSVDFDIRDLVPATDGVAIYGSPDGGATKVIVKTDAGGAIQVDLEVASVTVTNAGGGSAVNIQDGGNSITVDATNLDIRDLVFATDKVDVSGSTITTAPSGTQDINLTQVLGVAPSATNPVPSRPTDGVAFLTNLGQTVATAEFNKITDGTDTALVTAAGELNVLATAQPGVDIGDVTINNAAGGAAVNIQDGGNSITVDNIAFSPDATGASSPSNSDSVALVASQIVKASAGTLYLLAGTNTSGSNQYIQVHNTTTVPADTAVPIVTFIVQAGQNFSYDFTKYGKFFSTGITVCNSSTVATKTIGASDIWFNVLYK